MAGAGDCCALERAHGGQRVGQSTPRVDASAACAGRHDDVVVRIQDAGAKAMTIAYCDCFSGISGDMLLGALVDAGVPLSHLQERLASLALPDGFTLAAAEVAKGGMRATSVEVRLAAPEAHHHRTLSDIVALIEQSDLTDAVKKKSEAVFLLLAQAEGRVHGEPVEQVHFHEVGAVDSIVDIVGAAIGLEYLGIERLYASALPFGRGRVASQHGVLPLPAPATLELARLANAPLIPVDTDKELVTPTGAAILGALATFDQPAMRVTAVGIGAGKRDMPWPNILRVIVGDGEEQATGAMVVMETNIDDMNPQLYGHVVSRLLESGAAMPT